MSIKSTKHSYGSVARALHWVMAVLFLAAWGAVQYRQQFTEPRTAENLAALQAHLSIGMLLMALVLLRIAWRLCEHTPAPLPAPRWQQWAARAGHLSLYALMLIMPITGFMGTGLATDFFGLFTIPKFEDTPLAALLFQAEGSYDAFEEVVDFIHQDLLGAWLLWLFIGGHALMALYHHFRLRDNTLRRITTG